jgi:hypothetical protein
MTTTHHPNGVTNVTSNSTLGSYVAPDPSKVHQFFDDFDSADIGTTGTDWLYTKTGAGTTAITGESGGVLLITNAAADNDNVFLQWMGKNAGTVGETFKFVLGKKLWFKTRFKTSDATQSDIVFGLQITDTAPLAVSDGVFFLKADGAATVDLLVEKNSTATTTSAVATLVSATYITLGFVWDGVDRIDYYVDDVWKGKSVTTNLVDDEELAVSFGIQNGEAVAKTLSVDYIFVAAER